MTNGTKVELCKERMVRLVSELQLGASRKATGLSAKDLLPAGLLT